MAQFPLVTCALRKRCRCRCSENSSLLGELCVKSTSCILVFSHCFWISSLPAKASIVGFFFITTPIHAAFVGFNVTFFSLLIRSTAAGPTSSRRRSCNLPRSRPRRNTNCERVGRHLHALCASDLYLLLSPWKQHEPLLFWVFGGNT